MIPGVPEWNIMNGDSLDACLGLVADRHRRRLLEHIRHEGDGEVRIDHLVDHLSRAEPAAAGDRRPSRDQLAIQLNHVHLPKLADHGVVEHDRERGTIEYRPDEQLEAVLDGLPEELSFANP
jgi:DNA-binding transcriptional ArsR family regulator